MNPATEEQPPTASPPDEAAMRALGAAFAARLRAGDVVLFEGELGAGKTTFIRGVLEGLGYQDHVRSPTFTLIQTFPTNPPVMHADLYRVGSHQGIGLEDYLETHVCLIEWADRAAGLVDPAACWTVRIHLAGSGRDVWLKEPRRPTQ